jgi:hypothetical protein
VALGSRPLVSDLIDGGLEGQRVDFRGRAEDPGHQRHPVSLDVLEHERGPARRWNSLKDPSDDSRDLPVRINLLLHVVELAPNFQRGQILAEILVGHVRSPPSMA